jgi:hypothetical protein
MHLCVRALRPFSAWCSRAAQVSEERVKRSRASSASFKAVSFTTPKLCSNGLNGRAGTA